MAASAKEVVRAFFDSFNQGNVDAVVALYEPNAKLVAQPGQVAEGHGAIREALNGFLAMKPTLTPGKNEVIETGDIVLSIISWTLKGTGPDGKPVQLQGTSSDILRKQRDGGWRFVLDNPWGGALVG